jgi:hypothetical protein
MSYEIYAIRPKIPHDEGDVYYGYTNIPYRFSVHRIDYDRWFVSAIRSYTSSYKLFMKYGFDNCEYVILEKDINTKQEAMEKEKVYIQTNRCVNIHHNIDVFHPKERKKREPKTELTPAQVRDRNDTNHKEKMKTLSQQHKVLHPELYKKHTCVCGATHMVKNIRVHLTSEKHQYFLQTGTHKPLL